METITLSKQNWSGEQGEVKLYADGKRFKVYDEMYRIVKIKNEAAVDPDTGEEIIPEHYDYKLERKNEVSPGWQQMDEKGCDDCLGFYGPAMQGYYFTTWNGELTRYHKDDPRLAAAILLFMLV